MNILYIHSTPLDSEKANLVQVLNMCRAFCCAGHRVTLITRRSDNRNCNTPQYISSRFGMDVPFDLRFFEGGFSIMGRMKEIGALLSNVRNLIRNELKSQKYDIVFIRTPIFMPFVRGIGVPVAYELHNDIIHYDSRVLNWFWERMLLRYTKKGHIKKIVVISEALKRIWIRKGISSYHIFAYHDGFNSEHFELEITKEDARSTLRIRNDRPIVMYTGSLYPDRGIELILDAADKIRDVLFYVVGGPVDQVNNYRRLVKKRNLDHVVFTGRVNQKDISRYLFAADVLLLIFTRSVPTIDYCSPLKMFEYMASGRLIIGHSFPTINEVLNDGKNAILVNPADPAVFVETLNRAVRQKNDDLRARARELAFEKYTWEKRAVHVAQYLTS